MNSGTLQEVDQHRNVARERGMPLFVPPASRFRIYGTPQNYVSVARDLLTNAAFKGDAVEQLERDAAAFLGVAHAVSMPQARVGIFLLLRALIKPGQEVILSPYTIHDVVNMVICAGGKPVFADIERRTCNVDAEQVRSLITPNTGAVLVTHLHGLACDIETIAAICRDARVPLLEDTAQAFGGQVAGRRLGTFGTAGIFSFGMAKNINSFYGGMVVTGDADLSRRLREELAKLPQVAHDVLFKRIAFCLVGDILTWRPVFDAATFWIHRYGYLHGIEAITKRWRGEDDPQRKHEIPETYLRRISPLQARLVRRALGQVDSDTRVRIEYARQYFEGLKDLEPKLMLPPMREDLSHIYLTYPIQVPDRHALLRFMTERGRDLAIQHIGNAADYECFSDFARDCPNARSTGDQVLLLPTYPSYGRNEVTRNIRLIREFFGG